MTRYYVLVYDPNEEGTRKIRVMPEDETPRTALIVNGRFRASDDALYVMAEYLRFDSDGFLYVVPEPRSMMNILIDRYRAGLVILMFIITIITVVNTGFILVYLARNL